MPTSDRHVHNWETHVPRKWRINTDYELVGGTRYRHVEVWRAHHGMKPDPKIYVIHHKDGNKRNNEVCTGAAPCPVLDCGNLALLTRADHIREHKPGKMSGQKGLVDKRPRRKRG